MNPRLPTPADGAGVDRNRPFAGACDCHAHVFGPEALYPYTADRSYTPPDAPITAYLELLDTLGLERGIIVQPSVYGLDNSRMLAAVREGSSRLRAIAVIEPDIADASLDRLHEGGVCGVRVNLMAKGGVGAEALEGLAARIRRLGWHIQLMVDRSQRLVELMPRLEKLSVPVLIDHLGHVSAGEGVGSPGFRALLSLLRTGQFAVKAAYAYGLSQVGAPYHDIAPLVQEVLAVAPDRILWGTDWPHPSVRQGPRPNDLALIEALAAWVPDEVARRKILVDNPAAWFRWPL